MGLVLAVAMCGVSAPVRGQEPPPQWQGIWRGVLTNSPASARGDSIPVTMNLAPFPSANGSCTVWRTTYGEGRGKNGVKDYRICRRNGPQDLYVDELNGIRLRARLLGNAMVIGFTEKNRVYVTSLRMRGDTLIEETLTFVDGGGGPDLRSYSPISAQRVVLRRDTSAVR